MAATKRKTKPPGRNISNAERNTAALLLRLPPLIDHAITERSKALGIAKAAYVSKAVSEEVARATGDGSSLQSGTDKGG